MDRAIYVALSGLEQIKLAQQVNSNNLANASTIGFKADRAKFESYYLKSESGNSVRVFSTSKGSSLNAKQGTLNTTGRALDIAMKGDAWLAVNTQAGASGYVHSASLRVNENGVLSTGAGHAVASRDGFTITVPAGSKVSIDAQGGVNVQQGDQTAVIAQLKVDTLHGAGLVKAPNGLISVSDDAQDKVSPAKGAVVSGVLEQSNVSAVESLISMMNLAREYEMNINLISSAVNDDKSSNQLLQVR